MKTPIGKLGRTVYIGTDRDDAVGAAADSCTRNFGQTNPSSRCESHRTQRAQTQRAIWPNEPERRKLHTGDFGKRTGRFEICARF